MIRKKKAITSIMEYVLVSMLSMLFVIGILFIFYTARNVAYKLSFELQGESIGKKLAYYESVLIKDRLVNSSIYFNVPKYFNGDEYLLVFIGKKLVIRDRKKDISYEITMPCDHPVTYLSSLSERFYLFYDGTKCIYKVGLYG